MTRTPPTPAEIVRSSMDGLSRAVRKLLIDNPNLKPTSDGREAHHVRMQPRTAGFVTNVMTSLAESILDRIARETELVVAMAADPDIPGLTRSYEGMLHERRVRLAALPNGTWSLAIADPNGFHDGEDVESTLPDEATAFAAARAFAQTGEIPPELYPGAAPTP